MMVEPDGERLFAQLACCNGYLRRIGDPLITNAIVAEIAEVLELPFRTVLCFARYGRLSGFTAPQTRRYSAVHHTYSAEFFSQSSEAPNARARSREDQNPILNPKISQSSEGQSEAGKAER